MPPDHGGFLVTGATGFIGRALIERLRADSQRVIAVTRRSDPALPHDVEVRRGDLASGAGIDGALFDGVGCVFHCAGELRNADRMRAVHVDGTERMLRALAGRRDHADVHWVQLSSVGAYGPPRPPAVPRDVTEETAENPSGSYEVTKTQSDELIRQAGDQRITSYTIVRPSAVIGKGMANASLPGLISLVRRGLFVHVGSDGALANYVHVDDVVRALLACAREPRAKGETFNVSSDCRWTELIERIATVAGVRAPRRRIPAALARAVALVAAPVPFIPLSPARIDILTNRTRYSTGKIRSRLGFEFARPLPAAVDEIVERC